MSDDDGKHLRRLRDQAGDAMLDAIILSTGPLAYRRKDGIGVVPLGLLCEQVQEGSPNGGGMAGDPGCLANPGERQPGRRQVFLVPTIRTPSTAG